MQKQFTPCPACGALGEVNSTCQFCGTTITLKEGTIATDSRIVKQRTVTPIEYANKISMYHNIIGLNSEISKVTIGNQEGIINLNGDLIYPLGNEHIKKYKDNIIQIGNQVLNLENFEYIDNAYHNELIQEKIEKLSNAILNNPSELGMIQIGYLHDAQGYYEPDCIYILNTRRLSNADDYRFSPQLMIMFDTELLNESKIKSRYERLKKCKDFNLLEVLNHYDDDGYDIPEPSKTRYILCGNDIKRCEEISLRLLSQAFDILPEDAANYMNIEDGIFNEGNNKSNVSNNDNSGCMGTLALLISTGIASIYGIVELIKQFIV